jgi:hypothetical protein
VAGNPLATAVLMAALYELNSNLGAAGAAVNPLSNYA